MWRRGRVAREREGRWSEKAGEVVGKGRGGGRKRQGRGSEKAGEVVESNIVVEGEEEGEGE